MKKIGILSGIIMSAILTSAGYAQPAASLTEADNQFAFDLYSRLSSEIGNIFFSPYSLCSALSMTFEGARNQTADEMQTVLHLSSDDEARRAEVSGFIQRMSRANKAYELSTANALWAQKAFPFKEGYFKLVKDIYSGEARNLDFVTDPEGSRVTINSWVSKNTKKRINDFLPDGSINSLTRLVLTNAVYFKGKWSTQFQKKATKQDKFWLSPETSVKTAMMGLSGESFRYAENDQAQILELPYKGDDLSMLIVLPREKDIQQIERSISEPVLKQWEAVMASQPVDVYIPKFKFDSDYQMNGVLVEMGMKSAFDANSADFSGMTEHANLYIDQVFHKAWIDVNEEGTEAAAATALVMVPTSALLPPEPKLFRADHPFIFMILDRKTKHILFMGRVSDPR